MNPPRKAPAIPIRGVRNIPSISFPGKINFATMPAIKPNKIHAKSPLDIMRLKAYHRFAEPG